MSIARGLVGWWRFDENLTDASGNGNNGTGVGSPTFTSGIYGQALSLNGTNQRVDLGVNTIPAAIHGASGVTFSAWIRQTATSTDVKCIIGVPIDGTSIGMAAFVENKSFRISGRSRSSDSAQGENLADAIEPGVWYHIVGVVSYSENRIIIYINGELALDQAGISFGSSTFVSGDQTDDSRIGMTPFILGSRYFNGQIDNAMIYNRALTLSEIKTLYALGSPL